MVAAALAARVVEVITDLGAAAGFRYRYGFGCIVHGRTVLTAAHVVTGAVSVVVRDPAKREYSATLDPRFVGDANGPSRIWRCWRSVTQHSAMTCRQSGWQQWTGEVSPGSL
jgi:hypothetical protein